MDTKFGVVVVTCNRLNLLKECIDAIEHQTYPVSKTVIVNNASTDGTDIYLRQFEDDNLFSVIHSDENLGGAGGFYLAMTEIRNMDVNWVLIIDDDAIIREDFLEHIKKAIDINGTKYLAYSGVVIEDGLPSIYHRKRIKPGNLIGEAVPMEIYDDDSFECDVASFCGLVVHSSLLEKHGIVKKEFFIWHDDTEFCLRIHESTAILNINASKLDHKRRKGASDVHDWKNYYGLRNALYIYRHYAKRQYYKELIKITIKLARAYKEKDFILQKIYLSVLISNYKKQLGKNEMFLPGKNICEGK